MSDRIKNFGDKLQRDTPGVKRPGQFVKGDPRINPGGRPKIAKAWDAAIGKSSAEAFTEALRCVWDVMLDGAHPDHNGNHNDPNWRFAVQKVLEYSGGKPKEEVEISGSITPEAQALLEALRLTPHERRKVIDAQDSTVDPTPSEDAAAMAELVDGDAAT